MRRQTLLTVLAAAMLVLAGCAGSSPAGDGSPAADDGTADGEDGTAGDTDDGSATGTVQFYVSDDPGQIDDFRHLNVTISQIGFERAGNDTTANATATPSNATATPANGSDDNDSDDGSAGWVTRDVNSRTVDLTQLKGANATLIGTPQIPAGNYSKVFIYVDSINATLQDGTSTNVKLPSQKLQLTKGFALASNGTVSFVYDVSVFKAGNSGKYILKPVISQSGPDQQVNSVDDSDADDTDGDDGDTDDSDADEGGPPDDSEN